MVEFITYDDFTHGFVEYIFSTKAIQQGLFKTYPNNSIYIGVDTTNNSTGRGRQSVRIHSKKSYTHGLFILDLAHMPGSVCGTWPGTYWVWATFSKYPILE
jgi:hypothetical protein